MHDAHFEDCTFINVKFEGCVFRNTAWSDVFLKDVTVSGCTFEDHIWRCDKREEDDIDGNELKNKITLGTMTPEKVADMTKKRVIEQHIAEFGISPLHAELLDAQRQLEKEQEAELAGKSVERKTLPAMTSVTGKPERASDKQLFEQLQVDADDTRASSSKSEMLSDEALAAKLQAEEDATLPKLGKQEKKAAPKESASVTQTSKLPVTTSTTTQREKMAKAGLAARAAQY